MFSHSNKAQVTIFIIIAVLVVALGTAVYMFYPKIFPSVEENKAQFVENYFLDCINEKTEQGIKIMSFQGGYIELPEFEKGSEYMPFSNYYPFLGAQIPYWFYFSGNNIQKTQKPTIEGMEKQLAKYVNDSILSCSFDSFKIQGYDISSSVKRNTDVIISENYVDLNIDFPIIVSVDGKTTSLNPHKTRITSKIGKLYSNAEKIFNDEMKTLFLENYSLDILTLNAPVTGFELSCVPKIWQKSKIKQDIQQALQDNLMTLKLKGNDYSLINEDRKYFVYDIGENINEQVNFFYSIKDPMRFEVYPVDGDIMRADPVGNQPGINLAGLCYVPYHFVYDLGFPVLVRITSGEEIFQFPMVVLIDKTVPRNATELGNISEGIDFCSDEFKVQEIKIYSFDNNNQPIKSEIYYKCLDKICSLGETTRDGDYQKLTAKVPQCYNGKIIAKADGYKDFSVLVSSNEEFNMNIFLAKIYPIKLDLGLNEGEKALVTFNSQDYSTFASYPEQKEINFSEGNYNVSVYVLKDAQIVLQQQTQQQCLEIPVGGIGGVFGLTKTECFDVTTPSQTLTSVVIGGGSSELSLTESQLIGKDKIKIGFERFPEPKTIDEISNSIYGVSVSKLSFTIT